MSGSSSITRIRVFVFLRHLLHRNGAKPYALLRQASNHSASRLQPQEESRRPINQLYTLGARHGSRFGSLLFVTANPKVSL